MKRLLSVARRFTKPQANNIHALDAHGLRAPWLSERLWRLFLMRPSTSGWKLSPFRVRTDKSTDLAMVFFWAGENTLRALWPLLRVHSNPSDLEQPDHQPLPPTN